MKKVRHCLIILCGFLLGMGCSTLTQAASHIEQNLPTHHATYSRQQVEDQYTDWVQLLQSVKEVEKYQVEMTWTNQRSGHIMSHALFQVDQDKQDIQGDFTYYYRGYNPSKYIYSFRSYNGFESSYVNLVEYLWSMAYFKQPIFPSHAQERLAPYKKHFVEVETSPVNLVEETLQSLILHPDFERLSRMDKTQLWKLNQHYYLDLERVEIPSFVFDRVQHLLFNDTVLLDLDQQQVYYNFYEWDVLMSHRLNIATGTGGALFQMNTHSNAHRLASFVPKGLATKEDDPQQVTFDRSLESTNTDIISKLTRLCMTIDEETKAYHIILEGLSESRNIDVFNPESNSFRTYEFQMDYQFTPLDETTIPAENSFNAMSPEGFETLLKEALKVNTAKTK
ncbi:hypothetical protein [Dolosicoccus paucivorans]